MEKELIEYLNSQKDKLNNNLNEISNSIHSKEIEMYFIKDKINKIKDKYDESVDILSPDLSFNDFNNNEISRLEDVLNKNNKEIKILDIEKENVVSDINKVKCLLEKYNGNLVNKLTKSHNNIDSYKIQEIDREKLSRDIHDGVVQNLSALIRKMEFVLKILDQDKPRVKIEIENSKNILKDSIEELRNIIYDLRPMSLNDLGFESAFYNVCEMIKSSYNGVVDYNFSSKNNDLKFIEDDIAISILRIIKELSSNSIKYSKGNHIYIDLKITGEKIILTQSDDGQDFDFFSCIGEKNDHTGYGLLMLSERVKAFDGTIKFDNMDGSKYIITFPLCIRGQ